MMLLSSNFYKIKNKEYHVDTLQLVCSVNPEHIIFQGHFPNQPVVPGVCMLQIIKEQLEATLDKKLRLVTIDQSKFLGLWVPETGKDAVVNVQWQLEDEQLLIVSATITKEDAKILKLSGSFTIFI